VKTYQHGGDIVSFAKETKVNVSSVIDLSSNINPLKPNINEHLCEVDISSYPNYEDLYATVSKYYGVDSNEIELFNGGSSAIFSLFSHFDLGHCTIYSPAYLEYKRASQVFGYDLEHIYRLEDLYKKPKAKSLVIFVNPSTPDGQFYDIAKLLDIWSSLECTVLIDESFIEFTTEESIVKYLPSYERLYILKSMTKFYSCAGVRMGTLVSSSSNISKLKAQEPLWKISQYDSAYIQQALTDKRFSDISRRFTIRNRDLLVEILRKSELFETIYPSQANYIMARLRDMNASSLQESLKVYKIMIRDCSNFDGLDSSFVRIAVKDEKSIEQLRLGLKSISELSFEQCDK